MNSARLQRQVRPPRTLVSSFSLIVLALAIRVGAEDPGPNSPGGSQDTLLANISADHSSLLVVEDPLPWLRNVLSDKSLERVLSDGHLAEFAQAMFPGSGPLKLADARAWLEEKQNFVPSRFAIGATDRSLVSIGKLTRFGVFTGLASASDALEENREAQLARFRKEAITALSTADTPTISIWAEMRREQEVAVVFNLLRFGLGALASQTGARIESDGDSYGFAFTLASFLSPEIAASLAPELGLADDEEDASARDFASALTAKKVAIEVRRVGRGLLLSIGSKSDPKAPGLPKKGLQDLYGGSPAPVAWGTWDVRSLREEVTKAAAEWRRWKDTKLGARLRESDTEDLLSTFELFNSQLEKLGTGGRMRARIEGSTLHAELTSEGIPAGTDLRGSPLVRAIPAHAQSFGISGNDSLADVLTLYLGHIEDLIGRQGLRAMTRGDLAEEARWDDITEAYYTHFEMLRRAIIDKAPKIFSKPSGWIVDFQAEARSCRFTVERDGKSVSESIDRIPLPELALFTHVDSSEKARELVTELWKEFGTGLLRFFESTAEFQEIMRKPAASIGVDDAFALSTRSFHAALQKNGMRVDLDTDSELHAFFLDRVLILSSSPRLSRQIVGSWNGKTDDRYELPKEPAGKLTEYSIFAADSLASGLEQMMVGMTGFLELTEGELAGTRKTAEEMRLFGRGVAEVIRLAEGLRTTAVETNGVRTTRYVLQLKRSTF